MDSTREQGFLLRSLAGVQLEREVWRDGHAPGVLCSLVGGWFHAGIVYPTVEPRTLRAAGFAKAPWPISRAAFDVCAAKFVELAQGRHCWPGTDVGRARGRIPGDAEPLTWFPGFSLGMTELLVERLRREGVSVPFEAMAVQASEPLWEPEAWPVASAEAYVPLLCPCGCGRFTEGAWDPWARPTEATVFSVPRQFAPMGLWRVRESPSNLICGATVHRILSSVEGIDARFQPVQLQLTD